ncbi:MAG: hypothetical protein OYH77_06095 [Pseudomonadota bacterium]|nr:hypothetical protein [Pseudomonadota bacterium]
MHDGTEDGSPNTTIREVIDSPASRKGKIARQVVRDTITGQFLPNKAAGDNPNTTVVQTIYYTVTT